MDHSCMFKDLDKKNSDNEYPSNKGKKWTDKEEKLLLEELSKNMDINTISNIHNRTIGGINSRRREIAYNLYIAKINIDEIIKKTKLNKSEILETINRRENISIKKNIEVPNIMNKSSEITELKNEIISLKKDIKEMLHLIHQIYDFETQ